MQFSTLFLSFNRVVNFIDWFWNRVARKTEEPKNHGSAEEENVTLKI
jgi:hypothetical protein